MIYKSKNNDQIFWERIIKLHISKFFLKEFLNNSIGFSEGKKIKRYRADVKLSLNNQKLKNERITVISEIESSGFNFPN